MVIRTDVTTDLIHPDDPAWDNARQAWNLAVDQRPHAVALPSTPDQVSEVVKYARANGLRIASQTTGHHAWTIPSLDDAILLKTERLTGVEIDVENQRARCASGTTWIEVAEPASEHGLAALAGSSTDIGVAGYSLGGGIGWLARRHGLATNSVTAIEIVTADGKQRRVDHANDPELFWALRGGGGSFGAVTALEFKLYPAPELYAGWLIWPIEQAHEVLSAWRAWVKSIPVELTTFGRLLRVPPLDVFPAELRGRNLVAVEAAYLGDAESGANLLQPLRRLSPEVDTFGSVAPVALSHLNMDPPEPVPALAEHRLLSALPPEAIEAILDAVGPERDTSLLSVEIRHLGGALLTTSPDAGALATLDGTFMVVGAGMVPDSESVDRVEADIQALLGGVQQWDAGRRYANFAEEPSDASSFFPAHTYSRLQRVKAAFDPDDIFLGCHPITPAGASSPR